MKNSYRPNKASLAEAVSHCQSRESGPPVVHDRVHILEGITVCIDYSDFLDVALQENLHHFDQFVVVTSFGDSATHDVCERHGVICVQTDLCYESGSAFNKGLAINLGLAHLRHEGWLIHLDADIVLPDRLRTVLEKSRLDKRCVYGADRVNVRGFAEWERVKKDPAYARQFHHRFLINVPEGLPLGARLLHDEFGYCPLGFFQLWHSSARRRYPINQGSAEHTDVLFSCQWPAANRRLLPGAICYHMESEGAQWGANWNGRQTRRFS